MELFILIPMVVVIAAIMFFAGWYVNVRSGQNRINSAEERAKRVLQDAEGDANALKREKLLEVKDEWYKKKKEFEAETQSKRNKQQAFEKQLVNREENVDRKLDLLNKKEATALSNERELTEKRQRIATRE